MLKDKEVNNIFKILNDTQVDIIELLNDTDPVAKQIFLDDSSLDVPASRYNNLDPSKLEQNIKELTQVLSNIHGSESDKELLIRLLTEDSLDRNKFALANYRFNNGDISAEIQHNQLNEKIYVMPDKNVFMDILSYLLEKCRKQNKDEGMYYELIKLLPELPESGRNLYIPSQQLLNNLHCAATEFYAPFLRYSPDKEVFDMKDICLITEEILANELGGAAHRWKIVYDKDRSYASVDQQYRRIFFPGKRNIPYYTHEKITTLLIHEIGVHVLRELVFDDISVELLRTGLPGYEEIDEGIAKVMEQAITCRFEHSGLYHYISIGLAVFYGLGFRDIYEIQRRIYRLVGAGPEGAAYDSVRRSLRGTNKLPNCKDLVYYNGTAKIWKYISDNIDSPFLFDDLLLSGKTNIFDPEHRRIIYQLKTRLVL